MEKAANEPSSLLREKLTHTSITSLIHSVAQTIPPLPNRQFRYIGRRGSASPTASQSYWMNPGSKKSKQTTTTSFSVSQYPSVLTSVLYNGQRWFLLDRMYRTIQTECSFWLVGQSGLCQFTNGQSRVIYLSYTYFSSLSITHNHFFFTSLFVIPSAGSWYPHSTTPNFSIFYAFVNKVLSQFLFNGTYEFTSLK